MDSSPSPKPTNTLDLIGLLGSRICHDLISPLGAIGNGVELLAMSGTASGPETALIDESVRNANARIRLFRIAFGAASEGQVLSRREVLSVIDDMAQGGRITIDWTVEGDVPRREVRLAFLGLQCFETVMPFGGSVRVIRHPEQWTLIGTSDRFREEPDLWDIANGKPFDRAALKAAEVHFALAPLVAQDLQRPLRIDLLDGEIRFRF